MRIFFRKIITLSVVTLLCYPIGVILWGSLITRQTPVNIASKGVYKGFLHTRITEADNYGPVEILAIGSSLSYRGIDPRKFQEHNLSLFNLGSSAQTHLQSSLVLKHYLHLLKPKYVIYECNHELLRSDGVEASLDVIHGLPVNFDMLKMALKINHLKTYNTLISSAFRQKFNLDEDFVENPLYQIDTYISGGYVEQETEYYTIRAPLHVTQKKFEPRHAQLEAFKSNIKMIHDFGAELFLINAPVTKYRYLSSPTRDSADSLLTTLGHFTNFNKIINLNDSLHFYDSSHLNQSGVEIFNDSLISKLFLHNE